MASTTFNALAGKLADAMLGNESSQINGSPAPPITPTPDVTVTNPPPVAAPPAVTPVESTPSQVTTSVEDDDEIDFDSPATLTTGEGQTPPAAAATPSEEDEIDEVAKDARESGWLPKEVEDAFLNTSRGRRYLAVFKAIRPLELPPDQGGIGFIPTAEQIRSSYQASLDLQTMEHEFGSGDPKLLSNFWSNWFDKDESGRPTQNAITAASTLAESLWGSSPEYYRSAAAPFLDDYLESLYHRASQEEDKANRLAMLNAARVVELDRTGKYRDIPKEWIDSPAAVDDLADRRADLDRRERELTERSAADQKAATDRRIGEIRSNRVAALRADINRAFDRIKADLPPMVYTSYVDNLQKGVEEQMKRNPDGMRQYNLAFDKAKRSGRKEDIDAAVRLHQTLTRPIIRSLRGSYLKDAADFLQRSSAARTAVGAEASTKVTGATSNSAPNGPAMANQDTLKRQPGESHEAWTLRRTRLALGAG